MQGRFAHYDPDVRHSVAPYPDRTLLDCLEELGYEVVRFGARDDWAAIIEEYSYLFGAGRVD